MHAEFIYIWIYIYINFNVFIFFFFFLLYITHEHVIGKGAVISCNMAEEHFISPKFIIYYKSLQNGAKQHEAGNKIQPRKITLKRSCWCIFFLRFTINNKLTITFSQFKFLVEYRQSNSKYMHLKAYIVSFTQPWFTLKPKCKAVFWAQGGSKPLSDSSWLRKLCFFPHWLLRFIVLRNHGN